MIGPAAALIAATIFCTAVFGAEPEHDPATRAEDMAEMATESHVSAGDAAWAQIPAGEPKSPQNALHVPLPAEYVAYVVEVCERYGLEPSIVFGIMQQESAFLPDVIGDNGRAIGIMQVQPRWHDERMARLGVTDLTDPCQAALVGCDFLAELLDTFGGSYQDALTYYRYGSLTVTGEDYAGTVMANAAAIRGE